jgi:hypothetical protein
MPGPQSSVPFGVRPSLPKQRFTLARANKALSLVTRIVNDIVQSHKQLLVVNSDLQSATTKERRTIEPRVAALRERLEELVDELQQIGVELKDPRVGLVDFVGRHQGRDVYLCWKLGEDKVAFFHELDGGFTGRQPVSLLEE